MAGSFISRPQHTAPFPRRRPAPAKFALAWLPLLLVFGLLLLLTAGPTGAQSNVDYDMDNDQLIDIDTYAKLRAIQWDLDGNGTADGGQAGYSNAFPSPASNFCDDPNTTGTTETCAGYELRNNITMSTPTWAPTGTWATTFDGKGFTLTGGNFSVTGSSDAGLFGNLGAAAVIRDLGLVNFTITATTSSAQSNGILTGFVASGATITNVYSSGGTLTVSVNGSNAGGLVGYLQGTLSGSYSTAAVTVTGTASTIYVGGLAGRSNGGAITASYATGTITDTTSNADANVGALIGRHEGSGATITNSYCVGTTGNCIGTSVTGAGATSTAAYTAAQLQAPTGYTDMYLNWNLDVDGDSDLDYPWNFGTSSAYPTLNSPDQRDTLTPSAMDYDADDDGLIDISTAAQFNAVRWDLNGDGDPVSANSNAYGTAFGGRQHTADTNSHRMGCPLTTPTAGCVGYELTAGLSLSGYTNWTPIGTYTAIFEGNGNAVTNLTITNATADDVGLFAGLSSTGVIRRVAVTGASVSGNVAAGTGSQELGILVGEVAGGTVRFSYTSGTLTQNGGGNHNKTGGLVGFLNNGGRIDASYSTAAVTGNSSGTATSGVGTGGLVGKVGDNAQSASTSYVRASYASGAVTAGIGSTRVGGLVGFHANGVIDYSYAYGAVSTTGTSTWLGGLVGDRFTTLATVTDSYYDSGTTGQSDTGRGTGQTTTQLQSPLVYAGGIYANWNTDVDGDSATANDDPWDFGTASQYPALKVDFNNDGTASAAEFGGQGRGTDYDVDDNGLIEVGSITQLDVIRHDLNGNGDATHADYVAAFPNRITGAGNWMGCPSGTCTGYELTADLTFTAAWTPIGIYNATFDGQGHTLTDLSITLTSGHGGFFRELGSTGIIRNVGLVNPTVSSSSGDNTGALVGRTAISSRIDRSFVLGGSVTGSAINSDIGGLVGYNQGAIRASYSTATAAISSNYDNAYVGGLVGWHRGNTGTNQASITASYAAGPVTGTAGSGSALGGLAGQVSHAATITNSFCDTQITTRNDCTGATFNPGTISTNTAQNTSGLQQPTGYTGTIYADWNLDLDGDSNTNDDPWDFGTASQYPALKFDTDGNGTPTAYEFGVQNRPNPNPAPQPGGGGGNGGGGGSQPVPVARGGGQPYHPASAHPEIYQNPRHEMTASCALKTTGTGDDAVTTSTMTFDLGTYTRPITLVLSLWDGQFFRTLQSQSIAMPELRQDGQTATVEVVTDPTQTRFRIDSQYGLNLVLGYADCRTDDP